MASATSIAAFLRDNILLSSIITLSVVVVAYSVTRTSTVYDSFPRIASGGLLGPFWPRPVQDVVWDGYQNVTKPQGKPFTVTWWAKDYLILPPKYLSSLRDAEWTHLSFFRNISDAFFLHTTVGDLYDRDEMVEVVKKGLNPRLPLLTSTLEKEIEYALQAELRDDKGKDGVTAQSFFTAIVHRTACRILVGPELNRNEEFIKTSTDFVMSIFITALIIVKLPLGPFRQMLAYPISYWHKRKLDHCKAIILPVVRQRIAAFNKEKHADDKLDFIDWSLMLRENPVNVDPEHLAIELIHNVWAGTSAPGGLLTDIVFQLLLEPRYREPLIKEAKEALGPNSKWSEAALGRMKLLDSFIRETNRLYPTGSVTCSRTVLEKPFTFSDGLTFPVGTRFGFPTKAMLNDKELNFDGFRFATDEDAQTSGATAMSNTNLAWGYGTHVCPGRYFAVRVVKMAVVTLLLNYDIKWVGKVDARPPPTMIEGQFIPNLSQKVYVKPRTAA